MPLIERLTRDLLKTNSTTPINELVVLVRLELSDDQLAEHNLEELTAAVTTAWASFMANPNPQKKETTLMTDQNETERERLHRLGNDEVPENTDNVSPLSRANIEADFAEQMKIQAENTDNTSTPVDNSVDAHVQEDNVNTDNTDNTESEESAPPRERTFSEIIEQLNLRSIRCYREFKDGTSNSVNSGASKIDHILTMAALDDKKSRQELADLMKVEKHMGLDGTTQAVTEMRFVGKLHNVPTDMLADGESSIGSDLIYNLLTMKPSRWSKKVIVEIHSPALSAYYKNLEDCIRAADARTNEESKKEKTPMSERINMREHIDNAKNHLDNLSLGDRISKLGEWVTDKAKSMAQRIIDNLNLAAKWTLVSFYGLWYYVIVVMAMGNGASIGAALLVALYVMAIWTAKWFFMILLTFVVVDMVVDATIATLDWMDTWTQENAEATA